MMAAALALLLILLWSTTHHYLGLAGDARLYAVQALAKSQPGLLNDLYLRNNSQDAYTIFSSGYANLIEILGLRPAALALTLLFKAWLFAAAWALTQRLSDGYCAIIAVALLIVTSGEYGAFGVFHYAEDWLTARSLAEALVVTALACTVYGWRYLGLLIACGALFIHPLLAFPGLLLIICLQLTLRLAILGAIAGMVLALAVSSAALWWPHAGHMIFIMDARWLEVVRERSQFLFLQLWRARDWSVSARPLLALFICWLVTRDSRIRSLCQASMLVGATGLVVGLVAGLVGPVGLLLQGQAWRWVWIAGFVSVLLVASTIKDLLHSEKVGPLCGVLMLSAWTFSAMAGTACLAVALIIWVTQGRLRIVPMRALTYVAGVIALGLLAWGLKVLCTSGGAELNGSVGLLSALGVESAGVRFLCAVVAGVFAYWIRANRSLAALSLGAGTLFAASAYCLPHALAERNLEGSQEEISRFSDWRQAIPPNANVFVAPAQSSAAFAWFTLERPSYLTADQSSGVVFSRETALEVRRRSQNLLPLMDPDWKYLSNMQSTHAAKRPMMRSVTRNRIIGVCGDPQMDFVVTAIDVGVESRRHSRPDGGGSWYLYDCKAMRGLSSSRE